MKTTRPLYKYFMAALAEPRPLLKFELENSYLTVYGRENLGATEADGWKWSLVCTYNTTNRTTLQAVNRITAMLAEQLRHSRQDVNILRVEGSKR